MADFRRLAARLSVARLSIESVSLNLIVALLIAIALFVVAVVIPALEFDLPETRQNFGETQRATITRVLQDVSLDGPRGPERFQEVEARLDGQTIVVEHGYIEGDARSFDLQAGDRILVNARTGPEGDIYQVVDFDRGRQLWILAAAFAIFVLIVGRWQGLTSLLGLAASLLVILRFIVPGIVSGHDPVTISIAGAAVIMFSSLYLAHGVNLKTTTALVGTILSLSITAALATFSVEFAQLSGLADEQAATLNIISSGGINPEGLLLAGIIIGSLGVLDDVTVAQASAVNELRAANPLLTTRQLFNRAMNIGRDHIASTVNTLFLAYAGAALPLLIIFSLQTEPAGLLVSRDFLATEVVRTLVGSIGIVASVPLTTALAAYVLRLRPLPGAKAEV